MFVHRRPRLKTQGAVFSTVALLALGACENPVANTDLRPEGAPEVLTVMVSNDPTLFGETATFCKLNDAKRPSLVAAAGNVQICDDDLSQPAGFRDPDTDEFTAAGVEDAVPTTWYARVMFDELLDPNVEDLIEITQDDDDDPATPEVGIGQFFGSLLATQPVVLKCTPPGGNAAVDVPYDGYYSPSGNAVTWPLGPSLFIQPVDASVVASGSTCTVELKDTIHDKDNVAVPVDQRGGGGVYQWGIAPLEFLESDPAPEDPGDETTITSDAPVVLLFNGFIDPATLAAAEITIQESAACDNLTGAVTRTAVIGGDPADHALELSIAGAVGAGNVWNVDKAYTITFSDTNEVADVAGGAGALPGAADFTLCFTTEAP